MKLLLVDDDDMERELLRDILRSQGPWDIEEAKTAQDALDRLREGLDPVAVFLDVRMPGIDGTQLLTMIRREPALRDLKVIISSGMRDREVIVGLGKLGIAGYLTKPYEAQKTTATLTQLLGVTQVTTNSLASRNLLAKTVLIVDDDAMVRRTLGSIMRTEAGWEVVEAQDGLVALEMLRNGLRPDLGIFDLRMPKLDGHTLLMRIRDDNNLRMLPVVIASGMQDRPQIRALAQLRISGYLLKPLDLSRARTVLLQAADSGKAGAGSDTAA